LNGHEAKDPDMTDDAFPAATQPRTNGADKTIADAGAAVQDTARKLGDQAAAVGERVYRQAVEAGKQVSRQIEEQPWGAVIVSGFLGLAIGILLGRGSVPAPRTARDRVDEYLPRSLRQR
jgi:ElaB/YqjD/DUF883 family membrane-anchored ribosome-binding protein